MTLRSGSHVLLVFDRDYGDRLLRSNGVDHVWLVESPTNLGSVEAYRATEALDDADEPSRLTTFAIAAGKKMKLGCADLLELVDDHHGEFSDGPSWSTITVTGVHLDESLRQLITGLGGTEVVDTDEGFRVSR